MGEGVLPQIHPIVQSGGVIEKAPGIGKRSGFQTKEQE